MHFDAGYIGRILAAWIVTCLPTVAEEGWRMAAIRVPPKDAAAIRNELSIAENAPTRGNLGTTRRIVLNILHDDPGIIKTMPRKRFDALMKIACREMLL